MRLSKRALLLPRQRKHWVGLYLRDNRFTGLGIKLKGIRFCRRIR